MALRDWNEGNSMSLVLWRCFASHPRGFFVCKIPGNKPLLGAAPFEGGPEGL